MLFMIYYYSFCKSKIICGHFQNISAFLLKNAVILPLTGLISTLAKNNFMSSYDDFSANLLSQVGIGPSSQNGNRNFC